MKKGKLISEKEAQERTIDNMLSDVSIEDRGPVILDAVKKAGGMMSLMYPKFETCPQCGHNRLPVEAHNGARICRSCRAWVTEEKAVA